MKRSQIEHIIKRDTRSATPDILNKIDWLDLPNRRIKRSFKEWLTAHRYQFGVASLALIVLFAVLLVRNRPHSVTPEYLFFDNQNEVFTMAVMTAMGRLEQQQSDEAGYSNALGALSGLAGTHIHTLSNYIALLEPIMHAKQAMQFTYIQSPLEDYETMVIFTSNDLRFQPIEFTLHFTASVQSDERTDFDGLVVLSRSRYTVTGTFANSGQPLDGALALSNVETPQHVMRVTHDVTEFAQRFVYAYHVEDTLIESSTLRLQWDSQNLAATLELFDSAILFTLRKEQIGFTQRLAIEYTVSPAQAVTGNLTARVVYDTAFSQYRYHFTSVQDRQQIVIRTVRTLPALS